MKTSMLKIGVVNRHTVCTFRRKFDILVFHFGRQFLERKFLSPPQLLWGTFPATYGNSTLLFRAYTMQTKFQMKNCWGANLKKNCRGAGWQWRPQLLTQIRASLKTLLCCEPLNTIQKCKKLSSSFISSFYL